MSGFCETQRYMAPRAAATALGISKQMMYRFLKDGRHIQPVITPAGLLVRTSDVQALKRRRTQKKEARTRC